MLSKLKKKKMSDIVIKFENISKQYRLGTVNTGTISHDINRWWHTVRGKEDPYLKIGDTNDRSSKAISEYVWALQDITFDVKQGDVVGIIGKNGAGKSTLLKILSRVTSPTTGTIKARGRIASLLEVGTGFHPELTGRENIYMNGAIMGMTKNEISRKLDEIVDFAGIEKYIDTPTKRYSSGMTVRLGFAIAAHLEPEILVVDEVLAVGDAEFQKKAIGKMQDVSQGDGRTVLFVSHNMAAVKSLCKTGVLLENGICKYQSTIDNVIEEYFKLSSEIIDNSIELRTDRTGDLKLKLIDLKIFNSSGIETSNIFSGETVRLRLFIQKNTTDINYEKMFVGVELQDIYENVVAGFYSDELGTDFSFFRDQDFIDLIVPSLYLREGNYTVSCHINHNGTGSATFADLMYKIVSISVISSNLLSNKRTARPGNFAIFPSEYK